MAVIVPPESRHTEAPILKTGLGTESHPRAKPEGKGIVEAKTTGPG